jgi:dimethylargininase
MLVAITRIPSPALARCELTHLPRQSIDVTLAIAQHREYESCLAALGCEVVHLADAPDLPDAVFVEDAAVVLDEAALVTMPGAASRRGELPAVAEALARFRLVERTELPATIEGGDVLRVGRSVFVGRSPRTNEAGVARLRAVAEPLGYAVVPVEVTGCLHLKSAVTALDDGRLLANTGWIDMRPFAAFDVVEVAREEPGAANVLRIDEVLVADPGCPRTLERIAARGYAPRLVDVSEFRKAEAALTCKSLLLRG